MFVVYKTKAGDTMDTIIASQRIRDPSTVLLHKKNKKFYKDLKAGKELPKGTKLMIPDPKATYVNVQTRYGMQIMDTKTYKEYKKGLQKQMDEACRKIWDRLDYAIGRHVSQRKILEDQWIVGLVLKGFSSTPEPKSRKKAESAYKAVKTACKAGNPVGFSKVCDKANLEVTLYYNETLAWIEDLIGTGYKSISVLEGVRDVGMACGSIAAASVVAPASLMAAAMTGAATSGGVRLAYDGADGIGRGFVGTKQRSASDIAIGVAGSAGTGAFGALVVGTFMKLIGPRLISAATSNKFVVTQSKRLLIKAPFNLKDIYTTEVKLVAQKIGWTDYTTLQVVYDNLMKTALLKFFSRVAMAKLNKMMGTGGKIEAFLKEWLGKNPKSLQGKDPSSAAQRFYNDVMKSSVLEDMYDDILRENKGIFLKILRQDIKEAVIVEMKKQRA